MQLAFSTLACPTWSLEEILAAAGRYGYDGVEWRGLQGEIDLRNTDAFALANIAATRARFEAARVRAAGARGGIVLPLGLPAALLNNALLAAIASSQAAFERL